MQNLLKPIEGSVALCVVCHCTATLSLYRGITCLLTTNTTGRGVYLVSYMGWQDVELAASQERLCHQLAS